MKKIAFLVQWMLCGGVENALISLTKELVDKGNNVTIYVIAPKGDFIDKIPEGVRLLKIPMSENVRQNIPIGGTKVTARECIEHRKYIKAIKFFVRHKLNKQEFAELNIDLDLDKIPELEEKYDIAVNYHIHSPFLVWYLSERVRANKKYTWIHNDFKTTKYKICNLERYLTCVDRFFGVSKKIVNEFVECIPEYKEISEVFLNIVPVSEILAKADEFYPDEYKSLDYGVLKILTVGRLEEQKGYDLAIEACEKLIQAGKKIEWFAVGNGTLQNELEKKIEKKHLDSVFHLLGVRMNPYPYFKNCDIYVQPSRHEGWGLTLTEAIIFNKPIITTNFAGATEQIHNGVTGIISDTNSKSIAHNLTELVDYSQKRNLFSQNLASINCIAKDNGECIAKIFC
jgi:glycosyltransferase involved in cell wall biosynthesis